MSSSLSSKNANTHSSTTAIDHVTNSKTQTWKEYLHSWYIFLNPYHKYEKKQTKMTDYYSKISSV